MNTTQLIEFHKKEGKKDPMLKFMMHAMWEASLFSETQLAGKLTKLCKARAKEIKETK